MTRWPYGALRRIAKRFGIHEQTVYRVSAGLCVSKRVTEALLAERANPVRITRPARRRAV